MSGALKKVSFSPDVNINIKRCGQPQWNPRYYSHTFQLNYRKTIMNKNMVSILPLLATYIFLVTTVAFSFQTPLYSRSGICGFRKSHCHPQAFRDAKVLYSTDGDDDTEPIIEAETELEIVADDPPQSSLDTPGDGEGSFQFDYFSV